MPVAIPWIGLALTAAGTGVAVAGHLENAAAQEKAAKFNAKVAENNAVAQKQQTQFDSERLRKRQLIMLGRQRAAAAKSGIEGGSLADVLYSSELEGELDQLSLLYTGSVAVNNLRSSASLYRAQGQNAGTMGLYNAAGTAASGAGSLLTDGYKLARAQNPGFGNGED